jgi:hypothetical protein
LSRSRGREAGFLTDFIGLNPSLFSPARDARFRDMLEFFLDPRRQVLAILQGGSFVVG